MYVIIHQVTFARKQKIRLDENLLLFLHVLL